MKILESDNALKASLHSKIVIRPVFKFEGGLSLMEASAPTLTLKCSELPEKTGSSLPLISLDFSGLSLILFLERFKSSFSGFLV
jgi:hypothetical protein